MKKGIVGGGAPASTYVGEFEAATWLEAIEKAYKDVAGLDIYHECAEHITDEECHANERLIEASPVMLDVLEKVEAYLDYRVGNKPESRGYSVLTDVRAAIAKAKGEIK